MSLENFPINPTFCLNWGEDISPENKKKLEKGEVGLLCDKEDIPYSYVLLDSFGEIRELKIGGF